jgi:hypothetical protein
VGGAGRGLGEVGRDLHALREVGEGVLLNAERLGVEWFLILD